jgi:hypothetical protein
MQSFKHRNNYKFCNIKPAFCAQNNYIRISYDFQNKTAKPVGLDKWAVLFPDK